MSQSDSHDFEKNQLVTSFEEKYIHTAEEEAEQLLADYSEKSGTISMDPENSLHFEMQATPNILEESLLESIVKESPMIASFLTTGSGGDESTVERCQGRSMPYVEKMMTTSLENELKEKMKRLIFKKRLLAKELQEHKKEIATLREMIINMKSSEDHDFETKKRSIGSDE